MTRIQEVRLRKLVNKCKRLNRWLLKNNKGYIVMPYIPVSKNTLVNTPVSKNTLVNGAVVNSKYANNYSE